MPLTLITGPANAGKAGRVLDAYRASLHREPLLVVPTLSAVGHYQRELAADGVAFGGTVVRFAWLVRGIARRTGGVAPLPGPRQRDRTAGAGVARARVGAPAGPARPPGV